MEEEKSFFARAAIESFIPEDGTTRLSDFTSQIPPSADDDQALGLLSIQRRRLLFVGMSNDLILGQSLTYI